ncbi:MAG: YbdD/YjiX family protein [Catenulisporales bacterium]|nr:YbdD/YjiX family protein [Catenulisporales bacterium]
MTKILIRALRFLHWYLGEISGDAAYDRHVDRHRREHPGAPAPSRREYERDRARHREHHPASRCC